MKISAVACFSNELAIASAFRDQLETFFDKSFLVSHNSHDKTDDLFLDSEKFSVTSVNDLIFNQAELVRNEMIKAFKDGADWVIFLDFDEFLPFENRDQLEKFLSGHSLKDAISWNWQNIFPEMLGHPNLFKMPFLTIADVRSLTKIIVSKKAFEKDPDLAVSHGSHHLISNQKLDLHKENYFRLLHIPIHGVYHLKQKILRRIIVEGAQGFFKDCMDSYISRGSFDVNLLRAEALNYAQERKSKDDPSIFEFSFPYVKSQYQYEKESTIDSLFGATYTYILNREDSERTLVEREIYINELTSRAILQSRSWKITKPLRDLNGILKRFNF